MKDYPKKLWEPIRNLSKMQFFITGFIIILLLISTYNPALCDTNKEYVPILPEKLDDEYASKLKSLLNTIGIEYKTGKTKNEILVSKTDQSNFMLWLSGKQNLPQIEKQIRKRFDSIQELQEKIASALKLMSPIEDAIVTLNILGKEKTAYVSLKLIPNSSINESLKKAISVFVSSTVE